MDRDDAKSVEEEAAEEARVRKISTEGDFNKGNSSKPTLLGPEPDVPNA